MKVTALLSVCVLSAILMTGCAPKRHTHDYAQQQASGKVFTEVAGDVIPKGLGVVHVLTSLKTHPAGFYPLESVDSHHGSDHYPFVLVIGEQAATLNVTGVNADTPKYAPDGSTPKDPEAGPGMRYTLDKRLSLKPGAYDIRLELPDDNASAVARISIVEGKAAVVEFRPIYKMKDLPVRMQSYRKGVSSLEVYVDGKKH